MQFAQLITNPVGGSSGLRRDYSLPLVHHGRGLALHRGICMLLEGADLPHTSIGRPATKHEPSDYAWSHTPAGRQGQRGGAEEKTEEKKEEKEEDETGARAEVVQRCAMMQWGGGARLPPCRGQFLGVVPP